MFKKIQNFQLISIQSISPEGVTFIKAKQINSDENFTLKKIKIPTQVQQISQKNTSAMNSYKVLCDKLLHQANILNILNNQSCPRFHRILKTKQNLYLVYDYHPSNSLMAYFKKAQPTYIQKIRLCKKICQSVIYIHSKNIYLNGISSQRILINKKGNIFFTNFQNSILQQKQFQQTDTQSPFQLEQSKNIASQKIRQFQRKDIVALGAMFKQLFQFQKQALNIVKKQAQLEQIIKIVQKMTGVDQKNIPELSALIQIFKSKNSKHSSTEASSAPSSPSSPTFSESLFMAIEVKKSVSRSMKKTRMMEKSQVKSKKSSSLVHSVGQLRSLLKKQNKYTLVDFQKSLKQILKQRNSIIFLIQMSKFCSQFNHNQLSLLLIKQASYLNKKMSTSINQAKPVQEKYKQLMTNFINQTISLDRLCSEYNITKQSKLKKLRSLNSTQLKLPVYIQKMKREQENRALNKLILEFGSDIAKILKQDLGNLQQNKKYAILKNYYFLSNKIKYGTFEDFFSIKFGSNKQLWKVQYFQQFQRKNYGHEMILTEVCRRVQKWKQKQSKIN